MSATEQVERAFPQLERRFVNESLYAFYIEARRFPSNAEFQQYFLDSEGAD